MKHSQANDMTEAPQPIKRLLPLLLLIFIDTLGYFIVLPIVIRLFMPGQASLLPTQTSMGMRDFLYSLTLMLSPIAFIICSPLLGHLSDRIGRKRTLMFAIVASIAGFLIPIIGITKRQVSWILIGRFIAGASSSSQPLAQAAATDFSTGKKRAFYLGLIGFAMTLGMVLGPLAGSYLSNPKIESWFIPTTPYWFAFALSVLNLWLIWQYYSDAQQVLSTSTTTLHNQCRQLWRVITYKKLLVLMLAFFFMEVGWSQYYQSTFLFFPQAFKYSVDKVSLFAAFAGIWMCVGLTIIYKKLLREFDVKTIAFLGLITTCVSLTLCNIPTTWAQWIFIIPTTIGVGIAYPSLLAKMSEHTNEKHQGYVLGAASTFLGAAWMMTGLLSGPFVQIYTMLPMIISAVSLAIALFWLRQHG